MKKTIQPEHMDTWKIKEPDAKPEKSLSIFMTDKELIKAYIDKQTNNSDKLLFAKTLERKGFGHRKAIAKILDGRSERPTEIIQE